MSELMSPWNRLEIVQGASNSVADAKAKVGQFRDTVTGKHYKTLEVVPVFVQEYRVFFGSNVMGATPRCQSFDGMVPAPIIQKPMASICKTCPHFQWVGGNRPDCKEKRILYFFEVKTQTPMDLILPGTSVTQTKVFKKRIEMQIARQALMGKKLKFWDFKVTLALVPNAKNPNAREIDYRNLLQRKDAGQHTPEFVNFVQLALPTAA